MKIKWSALVSDVRGKLNGSVASRNRYGSYFRNKVTPINPQTAAQMKVRGIFGAISRLWGQLTESQRKAWEAFSSDHKFTDIFGDTQTLQGNAMFQKVNMNLHKIEEALISSPGEVLETPYIIDARNSVSVVGGVIGTMSLDTDFGETPEDDSVIVVYATPALSAGKRFTKNEMRFIGSYAVDDTQKGTTINLLADFKAVHGDLLNENEHIDLKVATVSKSTGLQSPVFPVEVTLDFQ